MKHLLLFFLALLSLRLEGSEIHVLGPKSMKGQLTELSNFFEKKNDGCRVSLEFGKSPELAGLIERGAPADLLITTDEKAVESLRSKNLIQSMEKLLADPVVIVGSPSSKLQVTSPQHLVFPELKQVSLFPEDVLLGVHSRAYLKKVNLFDLIAERIHSAKDPKFLMKAVSSGEADWGFVYASDVGAKSGVKVLWNVPETEIQPRLVYVAVSAAGGEKEMARAFLETLRSTIATKLFENAGFRLVMETDR